MNILGIDTSTNNCSVGLVTDGKIIGQNSRIGRSMASEQLIELIDGLLSKTVPITEIDAIAVSIGPGSYTGLRIGLSTAKGLAFNRKLPVLPVPTMAVLESAARRTVDSDMVLLIKSHRDLAYYVLSRAHEPLPIDEITIGYETFSEINKRFGNKYLYVSPSEISPDVFQSLTRCYPGGEYAALLAFDFYDRLLPLSTPGLEPMYFSEFEVKKWKPNQTFG